MTVNPNIVVGAGKSNTQVSPQPGMFISLVALSDSFGNTTSATSDGRLNVVSSQAPVGSLLYQYAVIDVVNTAAANNYMSVFNPLNSGKTLGFLRAQIQGYATSTTSTTSSMTAYRTTAASGGTSVPSGNISKYVTTQANSVADVRVGNPTVTTLNNVSLFGVAPPVATGVGGTLGISSLSDIGFVANPGEGVVIGTAAGSTSQYWNVQLIWAEF